MQSSSHTVIALLLTLGFAVTAKPALADDGCVDFKWDVSRERALFVGPATAVQAGTDAKSAPVMVPNRLYRLRLMPHDQVAFPVAPAKEAAEGAFAGLATLNILALGAYRISIDVPVWIDVVASGALLAARDFEGQRNCSAPHKIVEFDLAGGQAFVLQFSKGVSEQILLTITPTPARKL